MSNYYDPMAEMLAQARAIIAETKSASTTTPVAPAAPIEIKATTAPKAVPTTTYEQCERYGASPYKCGCPDRQKRDGGSYTGLDGRPACKHMVFHQKYYTDIAI